MVACQRVRVGLLLLAKTLTSLAPALVRAGGPTPSYDVDVQLTGRTVDHVTGGITYYVWNYRVTGQTCINRALSHWVLEVCPAYQHQITNASTQSVDNSDLPDGTTSTFTTTLGNDPTTGVNGLKWDYASGNQLDKAGEYDDFSFVAPGAPTPVDVTWGSKGSTIIEHGSVVGPGCGPLPVQTLHWGSLKARY